MIRLILLVISLFLLSSCESVVTSIADKSYECLFLNNCPELPASPQKTVKNYYELINLRQYPDTWAMLTPRFKRAASKDSYGSYTRWWNKVAKVNIIHVELIHQRKDVATVRAVLTYAMKDGRNISDNKENIMLVRDSKGRWLIENKSK